MLTPEEAKTLIDAIDRAHIPQDIVTHERFQAARERLRALAKTLVRAPEESPHSEQDNRDG